MQKTVGRSEQQKEEEKDMAEDYRNELIVIDKTRNKSRRL